MVCLLITTISTAKQALNQLRYRFRCRLGWAWAQGTYITWGCRYHHEKMHLQGGHMVHAQQLICSKWLTRGQHAACLPSLMWQLVKWWNYTEYTATDYLRRRRRLEQADQLHSLALQPAVTRLCPSVPVFLALTTQQHCGHALARFTHQPWHKP